jgi:rhodanese-related sulfurtransferase
MKTGLALLLLYLTFSSISLGQNPDSVKVRSIPPAEFLAAYQNSANALMIDVREFFEYKKSRLKGAINIPSMGNLDIAADTINRNMELFFYCTSGFRSKRVAKFFYGKGFTNVYSLDGGIVAWRKEGLAVDRKRLRR